jgi:hypothetical protein
LLGQAKDLVDLLGTFRPEVIGGARNECPKFSNCVKLLRVRVIGFCLQVVESSSLLRYEGRSLDAMARMITF